MRKRSAVTIVVGLVCVGAVVAVALVGGARRRERIGREVLDDIKKGLDEEFGEGPRKFVNRLDAPALSPSLKKIHVPFSFDYPKRWEITEGGKKLTRSNFVSMKWDAAPGFVGELLSVGSLVSPEGADPAAYAKEQLGVVEKEALASAYPRYKREGEETTTVDGRPAFALRFSGHVTAEESGGKEDVDIYGMLLVVPDVVGHRGLALVLISSSMAGTKAATEVGVTGDLGAMLKSFRLSE